MTETATLESTEVTPQALETQPTYQKTDEVWELNVADDGLTWVSFSAATATITEDDGSAALIVELRNPKVSKILRVWTFGFKQRCNQKSLVQFHRGFR